ncbi:MAG: MBL fold metallo-hydrolase [Nitrososphaeria archaeon]
MHKWEIILPGMPVVTNVGFLGLCNVVLINLDAKMAIFDPGNYGSREVLFSKLSKKGLSKEDIEYVIISHLHYDHALNATLFPNAKVIVSKNEINYAKSNNNDPYLVPYLIDVISNRLNAVNEGDELFGSKFVLLPGHTGGTMGMLLDDGTLLTGDAIKYLFEAVNGTATFAYYNGELANQSLKKALKLAKKIVPGHDVQFAVSNGFIKQVKEKRYFQLNLKGNVELRINTI